MSTLDTEVLTGLATRLVERAIAGGATAAEAQARAGWELSVKVRLSETELVQEAGHRRVSLRVLRDQRAALTSTSDVSDAGLERCVQDALELLELSEADPFSGPAAASDLYKGGGPDLDLFDPSVSAIDANQAIARAKEAEAAALGSDARLTLSEGATFSRVTGASALVISTGFSQAQLGSYASLTVSPIAVDDSDKRRRGYYWTASRHVSDLEDGAAVGREAARRTLQKLNPRKVQTCEAPVIFDCDSARSIIGTFAGCIVGGALWRRSSYLLDRVGSEVASPLLTIVDDPFVPRGPGSRVFDGDGLPSRKNVVVEAGVLKSYLLDTYSARKLGLPCTASGSRGGASVSSGTSNFIVGNGERTFEQLVASTERGLLVTDMMGFGFNAITGDFSRGASGFWVENGAIAFPVSEVTISGNLDQMLKSVDAVGNDLDLRTSIASPSFRVSKMTISGT
ncbi:MAG TPA: metallopeptidase TldD-related protein [Polyangiaceae bacterium]|nr:metallopeptidase TldD-related protein [Polyangiaceae bacterium]